MKTKERAELKALAAEALFLWGVLAQELKTWSSAPRRVEDCESMAATLAAGIMASRVAKNSGGKDAD
ncbi:MULTISPECIES: hypothetical protein [unclassified Paraburkholderia]|uniref:hypothetical protein n=1 Tax=unclassified Paraburkholderia TaxID=2615204 RepID=UPI001621FADC|nr:MULTISPECIES: hypothetical protein [unclassified Paraburkholderia]MBB5448421.1 hypothetical protein [Paraburkholderia sp. WSM4177]MBB5488804.1 hypothetical protein [Paraburkholderia sp. WSM4180]